MVKWIRDISTIRRYKNKINKVKPEFTELEKELQEIDRILKMTDPEEKKKYHPKMKELLSKVSSYYKKQPGVEFNPKEFEDFLKYMDLMRELTQESENTK